jgi:hypothetical protein
VCSRCFPVCHDANETIEEARNKIQTEEEEEEDEEEEEETQQTDRLLLLSIEILFQ